MTSPVAPTRKPRSFLPSSSRRVSSRRRPPPQLPAPSRRTRASSSTWVTTMGSAGSTLPTADASNLDRVLADFRAHKVRGLARAITLVERRDPQTRELFEALGPPAKAPLVIGLTGSPGTGKSTLVDALVAF